MNNKYCRECGTENEPIYKYCKNCGAMLDEETSKEAPSNNNPNTYNEPGSSFGTIGGIPMEEMAIFIGAKAIKILPKFKSLEDRNSKVYWCWPLAILGYLLGPLGCSLWFFFRKMYKKAFLLLGIGFAIELIYELLCIGTQNSALNIFSNYENFVYPALPSLEDFDAAQTMRHLLAEVINSGASIASLILCGLFGYNAYKNHCIEKINEYKQTSGDLGFYRFGLASIGGTSGGMLTLGIILVFLVLSIAGAVSDIASAPII